MSLHRTIVGAGLAITFLIGGCGNLPQRAEEPKPAPPPAKQQKQPVRATPQSKQAEHVTPQQKQAERAAQQQQCLDSVKRLRDIYARWVDAERAASAAPRLTLAMQLGNLRKLRQELDAAQDAPCSEKAQAEVAKSMTLTETFYQNFVSNNRDYLATEQAKIAEGKGDRQIAKGLLNSVDAELARIEACSGDC